MVSSGNIMVEGSSLWSTGRVISSGGVDLHNNNLYNNYVFCNIFIVLSMIRKIGPLDLWD